MDVFNGLEDVRQYFQRLPAATGSTASPNYQHQPNAPDQNHDRSASGGVPYWPPQHEHQAGPPTRENTPQRPPSHHSETNSRPASHHNLQQHENKSTNIQANYNYVNHESSSSQAFQFPVPHSREAPTNSPAQQYQSHILPNPSYHQGQQSQQQQSQQPQQQQQAVQQQPMPQLQSQQRSSSRSDLTSPQSYHQLQPPQSQSQSIPNYNYHQNRSYYTSAAKPAATPVNSYKTVVSQPYNYDMYKQYTSQAPAQNTNNTCVQKSSSMSALEIKESNCQNHNPQHQQQQGTQQHKSTHNLPPITYYHAGRSREALRAPTSKPKPPPASTTSATTALPTTIKQYSVSQQQQQQQHPRVPQKPSDNISNYRNVSQYTMQNYNNSYYTVANTPSTNTYTTSYQSSSVQSIRPTAPKTATHELHVGNPYQHNPPNIPNSSAVDSVLDLSLKTIKTSADSTLDDMEESHRNGKYYPVRQMPTQQHSSATRYCEPYANQVPRNTQPAKPVQQASASASAPKVDFLPNFNMPMNQNYKHERRHVLSNSQNSYEKSYPQHHHLQHRQQQQHQQQTQHQQQQTQHQQRQAQHQQHHQLQQQHQPPQQPQLHQQSQQQSCLQPRFSSSSTQNNPYMPIPNNATKKPIEGLPRIDFPPSNNQIQKSGLYQLNSHETQRKRAGEQLSNIVQSKIPKMNDRWKEAIDMQIEEKFSSYQSRNQDVKPKSAKHSTVNGNFISSNNKNAYQLSQYQMQSHHQYPNSNNQYHQMNQTYVPSAAAHHYPSHISHGQQQQQPPPQQQTIFQQNLPRSGSHSSLTMKTQSGTGGGADKRVISILRSNLEMKGVKEAQKKIEQTQFKNFDFNQRPREVQQPSTDVSAPLQPKHGLINRQNVSPFTAGTVERSTPPTYKFPKAIDSVRFEADIKEEKPDNASLTNQSDLDGLAANLAARIRTKGELKQVSQTQHLANYMRQNSPVSNDATSLNGAANVSPPKDKTVYPPRRRLFSRNEEDHGDQRSNFPPRDKTGLRSSSETSIFDFPDSGDESEVPVSERQSLEDMRRDRKSVSKQSLINEADFKEERLIESPTDDIFNQACDNFLEQLMKGGGKKRGRRKKMEPDVLAKLETVTKEKPLNSETSTETTIKIENDIPKEENQAEQVTIVPKVEEESDSDAPLSHCKKEPEEFEQSIKQEICESEQKNYTASECSSDSETENLNTSTEKRKRQKLRDQIRKTKELTAIRDISSTITKPPKKPAFGDGSDFHPGWEEELYKYKKSIRMPRTLIQVTRPPNYHRLSTSLPDLDPCPSPTPSSVTDTAEYCKFKSKTKSENFDSDVDSNCSFNFSLTKNYDSEEGSSSVKSLNVSNKIMDRLLERYGGKKRKRLKKKEETSPKIIPKSENALELLPTPSLEVKQEKKKSETAIKGDSVFLGFRKKTVENFKDTFIKNSKNLVGVGEQFTTVVLKSRTRTETRVLKQKATIREVFGEDRPASAPPVTCVDELKNSKSQEIKPEADEVANKDSNAPTTKEVLKNKLLNRGKKTKIEIVNTLNTKNVKSDYEEKEEEKDVKQEPDIKSEIPPIEGEENNLISNKKRNKFRNIRRKGSSGFDYIRKKKKQVKKEGNEIESAAKPKRRLALPKTNPESVQDIQKEIKMWVLNKGIGETHLHRSARLGYTDITAYCLEKMQSSPSPKDNAGYTPLHEACSRGHLDIAKLLLLYGANASESAQGGIRPLHEAAENGYVEIVRLLLSYGADPNLATYSGSTPLSLTVEESTVSLLKNHINDIQGKPSPLWNFAGPASCFDSEDSGYDPLRSPPPPDPPSEEEDIDFEISDVLLPNLYTLQGESPTDRWVLLQDLSNLLKIKSKDALLKQINPPTPNTSTANNKTILRELKMADFLEQARCCQFLNAGEKINTRSSKIALVKYTDKVKQLLNVEKVLITAR